MTEPFRSRPEPRGCFRLALFLLAVVMVVVFWSSLIFAGAALAGVHAHG